jgi:hypothetical protein
LALFSTDHSIAAPQPRWALAIIVGAFVFCVTVAMRARVLATQDLYLHISIGRWILANRLIPDYDIFSAGMRGAPWVAHEWLASVGLALLHDHLGWGGVLVAAALMLALAIGALTLEAAPRLGPIGALCAAGLAWGLCVNHLLARPHIASLPLVVIWIAAHVRARRDARVPPFYLAPLMTLWANLHGSFMFGLAFTVLFAAEAVFESETLDRALAVAMRWSAFLGASVLAAVVTPYGLIGLLFPIHLMNMGRALETVQEWQASSLSNNAPLIVWCLLLLFLILWHGVRLPLCRLIMLMLLLYMAFAHTRYSELLGLATPLLVLDAVADMLSRSAPAATFHWGAFARPMARVSAVCGALLAAGIVAFAGVHDAVRGPDRFTPAAALAAVEARGIHGAVLNAYNFGGYLIFRGYAPFVDGRVDMYGNEFISRFSALDQLTRLLQQYHIAWTIFEPSNPRTVVMDNLSGWSRLYADDRAVVHLRTDSESR